jgi:hypothetical protein
VFAESRHNDRNRRWNQTLRFGGAASSLRVERLVVIATRASASASELLINGLTPFLPVVIVGDRTYGKPVGQCGLPFCDKVFAPVAFSMVNARGEGDYFDGLPVDCAAADDTGHGSAHRTRRRWRRRSTSSPPAADAAGEPARNAAAGVARRGRAAAGLARLLNAQ